MPSVHVQTVRRAAEIVGSVSELAIRLGASVEEVGAWVMGAEPVPAEVFLQAVDIVTAHDVAVISNADPNVKITPSQPKPEDGKPH
jgi:DNA-binding transcriptional regulator YdaS (Cro superfamily)